MILQIRDEKGNWIEVSAIQGEKGEKGEKGDTYTLTSADKQEIADLISLSIVDGNEVSY